MTPGELLTARLGGRWRGTYGEARCPVHDDRSPSLSVRNGERALLVRCHAGCDPVAIVRELRRAGHWPDRASAAPGSNAADRRWREQQTLDYLRQLWRAARPIGETPAETYLRERGLRGPFPPSLRFHPALKHTDSGLVLPAMVAGVQAPDRTICALHRTFLRPDGLGKAPVTNPKKVLGSYRRGAIRLAAADAEIAIGEGIETALSYMELTGIPGWAAICAGGMRAIVLPPLPLCAVVHLLVDVDPAGEAACAAAADRLSREGRTVRLARPSSGKDFNDALRECCHA